jgi:hypothetical protein
MKVKISVDLGNGKGAKEYTTNMFVICEWERLENRKVSDGRGIGYSDIACWAHTLLNIKGEKVPSTWREWVKENPDMDIHAVDETNPNPTVAEPTDAS